MNTDERIDYAEQQARAAGLNYEQTGSMQAFLLGSVLTHFDESPVVPMTDSRWRIHVRGAIEHATRNLAALP